MVTPPPLNRALDLLARDWAAIRHLASGRDFTFPFSTADSALRLFFTPVFVPFEAFPRDRLLLSASRSRREISGTVLYPEYPLSLSFLFPNRRALLFSEFFIELSMTGGPLFQSPMFGARDDLLAQISFGI